MRLKRPLLLALDEVADIAPIRSLPRLLSEGIQQGIVPVLREMSQARARWGEHETATMWSTPALRLVLAGVAILTRRSDGPDCLCARGGGLGHSGRCLSAARPRPNTSRKLIRASWVVAP